jgi:tetratricopeptide (TPR) repeat protein
MHSRLCDPFRLRRSALLVLIGLLACTTLSAQAADRCTRLRDEGIRLHEAGDAKRALPKLEEAQRCRPAARLLLYIGLSQRELGKLDEALASFKHAKAGAGDDTQLIELADSGIADIEAQRGLQPRTLTAEAKPVEVKPLPTAAPTTESQAPVAKLPEAPLYKRWWLWAAVGGAALALGVTAGAIVGTWPRLPSEMTAQRVPFALTVRF